jgi:uncharacterized OB-fold protein
MTTCKKCGKVIPDSMKKCPSCKNKVIEKIIRVSRVVGPVLATVAIFVGKKGLRVLFKTVTKI